MEERRNENEVVEEVLAIAREKYISCKAKKSSWRGSPRKPQSPARLCPRA